ncbi:MAG: thioredoxin [Patescibacteria group bacterium]|nr:thioredoxin [Patescibacteria group bacterium]MDD5221675.1 thioredoxin [Patescibacteria group bacterium]MDD5395921.1 thioredoxin [Patescibacteria group bacterium]
MMFDDKNFLQEVLKDKDLVLVDFFASWCGPCQALIPIIEELTKDYEGKVKIGKLNVEESLETAQNYDVMNLPTLIFFRDGKEIERVLGFHSKEELKAKIDNLLK